MIVYVDDCILIGNTQAIQTAISGIQKTFDITCDTEVEDFTGITITANPHGKKLYQPDLIETLITDFQLPTNTYSTPFPPGYIVTRDFEDKEMLSGKEMKTYRSGVGKLIYLIKFFRLDLANVIRELSKTMDKATKEHMNMMLRVLKYAVDTKDYGIIIRPAEPGPIEIIGYSDSSFANNKETQQSVTGYAIYANNSLITWKSKSQLSPEPNQNTWPSPCV